MTSTSTDPRRRSRFSSSFRSRRLRAALGLGLVLSVGVVGTQAAWTDSVTVVGTNLSTGTIDLKVNGETANFAVGELALAGMFPGNSSAVTIGIENIGTAPLSFTINGAATNPDGKNLAGALVMRVSADANRAGVRPAQTCTGATLAGSGTSLNGQVAPGRILTPGSFTFLCVELSLPTNAPGSLQGASRR